MLIRLTREEAECFGLLTCGHCGYPRNNHFDFDEKKCAHDKRCPGYKEASKVGKIVKEEKRRK